MFMGSEPDMVQKKRSSTDSISGRGGGNRIICFPGGDETTSLEDVLGLTVSWEGDEETGALVLALVT
jgi:hypothetical protein